LGNSYLLYVVPPAIPNPEFTTVAKLISPTYVKVSWSSRIVFALILQTLLPLFIFCAILWAKKHHIWPYLLAYLIPFLSWYTVNQGYYWHLIWIVFGNIPLLEFIAGEVFYLSQFSIAYFQGQRKSLCEGRERND
jgi:hypothetical protein